MTEYLLNSAVITNPGTYKYSIISHDDPVFISFLRAGEAEGWNNDFVSTLGYEETAEAIKILTGVRPPVSRKTIKMQVGDEAYVFRLTYPAGTRPDVAQKGQVGIDFIRANCEVGWLRRVE